MVKQHENFLNFSGKHFHAQRTLATNNRFLNINYKVWLTFNSGGIHSWAQP